MSRCHVSAGFSLVEIVIALGVVSFALVSVVGLLVGGVTTWRDSSDDRLAVSMAEQVLAELRSSSAIEDSTAEFFFDVEGRKVSSSADSHYRVVAAAEVATDYNDADGIANLMDVAISIHNQFSAQGSSNAKTVYALISR